MCGCYYKNNLGQKIICEEAELVFIAFDSLAGFVEFALNLFIQTRFILKMMLIEIPRSIIGVVSQQ